MTALKMFGVSGSGGSFWRHVNAEEARQPVGDDDDDDGEWTSNAHGAPLLSRTHAHAPAVRHHKPAGFGRNPTEQETGRLQGERRGLTCFPEVRGLRVMEAEVGDV